MKCEYCGANMPDPPSASTYSESYKELREEIGKLEYNNGILVKEKKALVKEKNEVKEALVREKNEVEDWLIACKESLNHHQSSEKIHSKGKKFWKGAAIFLMVTNALWLIMLIALASAT